MAESLIFIENKNEIDAIERYVLEDTIVIAMLPSAGLELSRRGIPFENTKSLFGADGHRETLRRSKLIVEGLRPFLNKINAKGVQHAFEKTWVIYFRVNLNYWLAMLCIINTAVKTYKPNKFIIIRNNNDNNYSLTSMVESYGLSNDINLQYSNQHISTKSSKTKNSSILNLITKVIFEFQLKLFTLILNKKNIFFSLNDSSNMPRFFKRLSKHSDNFFPVYLSVQKKTLKKRFFEAIRGSSFSFLSIPQYTSKKSMVIFRDKYNDYVKKLEHSLNDSEFNSIVYGVNLNKSILWCANNELKDRMFALYGEIVTLKRVLASFKPKAVFSQHSLGIGYALGEISLKEGIPGLLITHGTHVPQKMTLPSYEWSIHAHTIFNAMYPFVAIQTPWAKKFLKKQSGVVSKSIDTGPLIFSNSIENGYSKFDIRCSLFGESQSQKRIILHAGSPRAWQSYRPWVYETVDEYIHNINSIIKVIDKLSNVYFCIRFRPQLGLSLNEFKLSLLNSKSYGIYSDGVFEDFLISSDLLISYSSTTIEEALQNHTPVLQYDPDGKYEHIPGEILTTESESNISMVYSVHNEDYLLPALKWWEENHTEDMNNNLDWAKHTLVIDDNMSWLKKMNLNL